MVQMTQSLEHWFFTYHRDTLGLILLGHLELFTEELQKEYLEWCQTEEGKQYLKGGNKYDENHKGNMSRDGVSND